VKYVVFLISIVIIHFGIIKQNDTETVYIFFDIQNKEECLLDVEGQGYVSIKKYKKVKNRGKDRFHICGEKFDLIEEKGIVIDSIQMKEICLVDLSYLLLKKRENTLRQNPFGKIFLVERISENKFLKREVLWVDQWDEID